MKLTLRFGILALPHFPPTSPSWKLGASRKVSPSGVAGFQTIEEAGRFLDGDARTAPRRLPLGGGVAGFQTFEEAASFLEGLRPD
jgi:hypothetical protein